MRWREVIIFPLLLQALLMKTIHCQVSSNRNWAGSVCFQMSSISEFTDKLKLANSSGCNRGFHARMNISLLEEKIGGNDCAMWSQGKFTTKGIPNFGGPRSNRFAVHQCKEETRFLSQYERDIIRNQTVALLNSSSRVKPNSAANSRSSSSSSKTNSSDPHLQGYGCQDEMPLDFVQASQQRAFPIQWYTRFEIHQKLKGRYLYLQGNSLTRQLMIRMIAWLRDPISQWIVEHYVHMDMIYGFDQKVDNWILCPHKEGGINYCHNMKGVNNNVPSKFWSVFDNKDEVALIILKFADGDRLSAPLALSEVPVYLPSKKLGMILSPTHRLAGVISQRSLDRVDTWWFVQSMDHNSSTLELPLHLYAAVPNSKVPRLFVPLPRWPQKNAITLNKTGDGCPVKLPGDVHYMCRYVR